MLSSSIRTVTDADELRSALRPTDGVLTVTAAGAFKAKVVRIDLLKVGMQHARETAARGWHLTQGPNRAAICFPTQDGPSLVVQGKDLDQTSIALVPANAATWQTLTGPTHWGSISLSLEDWDGLVSTFAGSDLMPRNATSVIVTNRPALAALQRRQLAAVHLAETAPELIGNRDVARGLEQSLICAMADCLRRPSATQIARHHRVTIMARLCDILEERTGEAIYMPELCAELRVAERTLRDCCLEFLGVSPKKYLVLRRMHLARSALAGGGALSVTDVATSFGPASVFGNWAALREPTGTFSVRHRRKHCVIDLFA